MTPRKRLALVTVLGLAVAAGAALYWQSELIGFGAHWSLARIAAREDAQGDMTQRRAAVTRIHRLLLLAPPADAWVPELFDLMTAVSAQLATGEIDLNWAAYVYDSYERDLVRDRPTGQPRRNMPEIETVVAEYVRFYALQRRPDVPGIRLRDLVGSAAGESFTIEEIDQAAREGRDLTRNNQVAAHPGPGYTSPQPTHGIE